jgi:hypothetical protein
MDDFQADDFQSEGDDFQPEEMSLSGFKQNAIADVKEVGSGLKEVAMGVGSVPLHFIQSGGDFNKGPLAEDVQATGRILKNSPQIAKSLFNRGKEIVTDPVGSFYERPFSTALDVGSVVMPAGKALGVPKLFGKAATRGAAVAEGIAQKRGAKALGFTKRFLGDKKKSGVARESAQTLLDEGVITPFATAEDMAARTSDLAETSGQGIRSFLSSVNEGKQFFDPKDAIGALEEMRPPYPRMGEYRKIHDTIDNAVDTIKAHGDQPITWDEANQLKGTLQDIANWNSNKNATVLDKRVAGTFRESLDKSLEKAAGNMGNEKGFQDFKRNKRIFSATQKAEDPLFNRISSEQGNKSISLTDMVIGGPTFAVSGPLQAGLIVGIKRFAERFGNQSAAFVADKMAKVLRSDPKAFGKYAPILEKAAERGTQALAVTNETLLKSDPEYTNTVQRLIQIPTKPKRIFKKAS